MAEQHIVDLTRRALEMALLLGAPLLLIATVVSLLINVAQVLTSIQEPTISTVPRLAVVAVAAFLLMPWMLRRLEVFTVQVFSDFSSLLR